jgi:hypothetical protein
MGNTSQGTNLNSFESDIKSALSVKLHHPRIELDKQSQSLIDITPVGVNQGLQRRKLSNL